MRKIVFITTKCIQRKTLPLLKTDVFKLLDDKNIGKLFSKYELLSLDQVNFISDPSQIVTLHYLSLELPCLPSHLRQISQWPPNTILIIFFLSISLFFPSSFDHTRQLFNIPNYMLS